MDKKIKNILNIGLSIFIVIDIIILAFTLIFNIQNNIYHNIIIFDTILSIILIIEFISRFYKTNDNKKFIYTNWSEIFAAIPYDLIFIPILLVYPELITVLIILKFVKIILLALQFFETIGIYLRNTYLDEIFSIFAIVIIAATLGLYLFDPSMNNLFDTLWFVIVTLTTVGYGDVLPSSNIGKIISLILLIVGVLIFSAITAAMATYFTKRLINTENNYNEDLIDNNNEIIKEKLKKTQNELNEIKLELNENRKLNNELKDEISELKELVKNK